MLEVNKSNPGCLGLIATEVVVWLRGLVTVEVIGQSSIFIYGITIVGLLV